MYSDILVVFKLSALLDKIHYTFLQSCIMFIRRHRRYSSSSADVNNLVFYAIIVISSRRLD